ncbi:peptidase [Streptomyces sp. AV19]|uniref:trypsin-like serine peptidase n=1 Tax=Streptomyces sp. AV19 TaxID=2793068 RepID=UPI0018FEC1BD|nr:peptidase [Streptomyces sp. AV19]MBH1936042.1 peptidase [Streptomyces sp. AV19]MDG4534166.1 peptidase [Streptomyces sp. AV19]
MRPRATLVLVPVLALAISLGAAPAQAQAQATAAVAYTAEERRHALSYWTPERMRRTDLSVDLGRTGPKSEPWKGVPVKTVGKLYFVNAKGADTWCTAAAVRSGNRSTVVAAAHCVRLPASPVNTYTDLVFVPGYGKEKRQPHGVFPVRTTVTPSSWATDAITDFAALTVDPVKGKKLTDAVGGQKIAFGRKPGGRVTAFGYPATRPQRGAELLYCAGTAKAAPGDEQSVPCDMGGGASGGPWLADFDAKAGTGTLVSVNSHGDGPERSTTMSGPALGAAARQVFERAQKG